MPISGITVQVDPKFLKSVQDEIQAHFGGEVSVGTESHLVVVLETETMKEEKIVPVGQLSLMRQKLEAIAQIQGVVTVGVAYYYHGEGD
jgi:nitrate reductase NapAB chaperone NapD